MRRFVCVALLAVGAPLCAQDKAQMDRDLMDVTVTKLHQMYREHRYTVVQVTQWHLDRIARYNGIYQAMQKVDADTALARAAEEDAEAAKPGFAMGPLWGVPTVIKANTSMVGEVTTAGWRGYMLPGHELVAPRDATVVAKIRAAGAVILGSTNMPDFAASDTNRSSAYGRTGNAYDVRFSPGGSSGGTVTSITSNYAVFGTGTDTGNSIRMVVATSNLVGIFPTRGLVSIAGIAPLDWQLDNTGPIARTVEDAAIGLDVMRGEDPLDVPTVGSEAKAERGPFTRYLRAGSLKGKRFAVPAFILEGSGIPFQGGCASLSKEAFDKLREDNITPLEPETRAAFLKAVDKLREAGATVLIDPNILSESFAEVASHICTLPYIKQGTDLFLKNFGTREYHSSEEFKQVTGYRIPATVTGNGATGKTSEIKQATLPDDPRAEIDFLGPKARLLSLYNAELDRLHLDGFVYPAIQMPPVDETMPQNGKLTGGPHSNTQWVNMIGVPAISIPAGFYDDGLPFGIEFSTRPWHDGELISWAYDFEEKFPDRRQPVLVERGLLPHATRPLPFQPTK